MGTVINSGSSFNPNISASTYYGTCSTASATAAKTTTISGFELRAGIIVAVKFTNANTATSATLNVSSTGAKPLKYNGVDVAEGDINADNVATFIYDGTNYNLINVDYADDIYDVKASLERFQNLYGDELHPLVNADGNHIIDSEGDHVYSRTAAILKAGNNVSLSADNTISFSPTQLTVTLLSNGWSNKTQTVSAAGVTASNLVMYFPAPASYSAYVDAEIYATAQGTNSLTFTCDTVPSTNITVNVAIFT